MRPRAGSAQRKHKRLRSLRVSVAFIDAKKRPERQRRTNWSIPTFVLLLFLDVAFASLVATKVNALIDGEQVQRAVAMIVQNTVERGSARGAGADAPVEEAGEQADGDDHGMVVAVATAMLWSGVMLWLHKAHLNRAQDREKLPFSRSRARAGGGSGTGADRPGREAERGAHAVAYGRARRRGSAAGDGDPPV